MSDLNETTIINPTDTYKINNNEKKRKNMMSQNV